jgi:hypothetical protein
VLDFEATHHTFQVADFALSWRGHHDDVLRGYDEVRALSDAEWRLVLPVFWAWLFLGVKDLLSASYAGTRVDGVPPRLEWQVGHLRRHSPLLAQRSGLPALPVDG